MANHIGDGNSGKPLIITFKSEETNKNNGVICQSLGGRSSSCVKEDPLTNMFCGCGETWPLPKEWLGKGGPGEGEHG